MTPVPASSSSWRPLLTGDLARRAQSALEEIARDLQRRIASSSEPFFSLAQGLAGQALFFAYLDRALPGQGHDDFALDLLEQAVESLAVPNVRAGLYSGFVGVGWTAEHLQGWLLDPEDPDPAEEIAAALRQHLEVSPWQRHFDLIGGLVGFGLFGLERYPRPGAEECVELAVTRLLETAERQGAGRTWLTMPELLSPEGRQMTPDGQYDLGVAHGVPGVVRFLAEAAAAGMGPPETRSLLADAARWVIACKQPLGGSLFPAHLAPGQERKHGSRLAWCYGDLGVAAAMLGAARFAGEPSWEREALEWAEAAAARTEASSAVREAGLCHGAAGVAHLFNRLYQATGNPALGEAARAWFERTLGYRQPGQGCAGFRAWVVDDDKKMVWQDDPGFLAGSAGIGLALLAALFPIEPAWDRVLLASIPG
jgi:lantibiotic modifying enzyme